MAAGNSNSEMDGAVCMRWLKKYISNLSKEILDHHGTTIQMFGESIQEDSTQVFPSAPIPNEVIQFLNRRVTFLIMNMDICPHRAQVFLRPFSLEEPLHALWSTLIHTLCTTAESSLEMVLHSLAMAIMTKKSTEWGVISIQCRLNSTF